MRVAFADSLSCLPLRLGLEATDGLDGVELVGGTYDEADAALLSGEVELGLVSSAGWAQNREALWRVPGNGIASDGPAMSALLTVREGRTLRETRSVALTGDTGTGQVLARILLERVYRATPRYEVVSAAPAWVLAEHDAALLTGDAAFEARRLGGVEGVCGPADGLRGVGVAQGPREVRLLGRPGRRRRRLG